MGLLWEHYVLKELHACLLTRRINYWRDKQGAQHFVVAQDVDRAYSKHFDSLEVRFTSLNAFVERVEGGFGPDQF
jgi:hypothetical protein